MSDRCIGCMVAFSRNHSPQVRFHRSGLQQPQDCLCLVLVYTCLRMMFPVPREIQGLQSKKCRRLSLPPNLPNLIR
jgi:hypothetical protein